MLVMSKKIHAGGWKFSQRIKDVQTYCTDASSPQNIMKELLERPSWLSTVNDGALCSYGSRVYSDTRLHV